jgi:uncharacterized membrane protein
MRTPLSPPAFFLTVALAAGVPLAYFTPPFQVPDEPGHFLRAYALSEGTLLARNLGSRTGALLPVSLRELIGLTLGVPGDPEIPLDRAALERARELELRPAERDFLGFPTAALYSPLPYAPQALGIALGRPFGLGPLALLRLARLANLLAAALLIAAALRALPAYRWLLAAFALAPMALFLRSSVSADALTFAIAVFLGASIARLAFAPGIPVGRADFALVVGSAAGLCLTKPPYAPLVLAVLAILGRGPQRRRRAALVAAALAVAVAAALAAATIAASVEESVRAGAGVDPGAQIASSLVRPLRFAGLVAADFAARALGYGVEVLGRLGWLDAPVPMPALAALALGLAALLALDTSHGLRVEVWRRLLFGAVTAAAAVAIAASQYAMWTPYGAPFIEGIQGRYFHPLAPFAVWVFHHPRTAVVLSPRARLALAGALAAVAVAATVYALPARYYVP